MWLLFVIACVWLVSRAMFLYRDHRAHQLPGDTPARYPQLRGGVSFEITKKTRLKPPCHFFSVSTQRVYRWSHRSS